MTIKLIIVDDHPLVRKGLQTFLKADPEIEIVGVAINGLEAIQKVSEIKPDVVVMDIEMPEMDGIEATAIIKQQMPEVKVVMLTLAALDHIISKALAAGADSYVVKGTGGNALLQAIKSLTLPQQE